MDTQVISSLRNIQLEYFCAKVLKDATWRISDINHQVVVMKDYDSISAVIKVCSYVHASTTDAHHNDSLRQGKSAFASHAKNTDHVAMIRASV